ncbi:MAG TPA: LodA/GoxA family CTQ-dependent oxidase, partial [Candidatus Limnocylindria bacterium]|nr:LodA/GoxA family CTQ-dependent oxidase [Candidatus Limnocylindria bacterium]
MKPATSKAKSPADTAAKPETSETPTSQLATAPAVSPDALSEICYCRIFPSIGIARIGNSPDSYFVASEAPGHWESPAGGYKDPHGRIKRQAARFRIYAFNAKDEVVAELTSAEADIAWTVHLANKKADWYEFQGGMPAPTKDKTDQRAITKTIPRNIVVPGNPGEASRAALVIDPGPRFIQGSKSGPVLFDSGTFGPLPQIPSPKPSDVSDTFLATFDNGVRPADAVPPLPLIPPAPATGYEMTPQKTVLLGELQTDEGGRLLVLGGKGDSASLWNTGIGVYPHWTDFDTEYYFANNDFWHDDTSDGPVNATVRLRNGGRELEVRDGAWVVVAPPKFAPAHVNLTSLYDLAQEIARQKWPTEVPTPPEVSFTRDIYPILARLDQLQWVNVSAFEGHGTGTVRDFLGRTWFPFLQSNEQAPDSRSAQLRAKIFGRIRNPKYTKDYRELSPEKASDEANLSYMPQIWGDNGQIYEADHPVEGDPGTFQTLLLSQYALLERWKNGDFIADWSGFRLRQHALNEVEKQYPNANLGTLLASLVGLVFHDRELFRAAIEAKGENLTKAQVDLLLFHSVDGRAVPQKPSFDQIPLARQPAALTEAALEPCVGGPFYPGIEATYIMTFFESWSGPFRLNATQYRPGDITKHMALPWQADFFECNLHWWPAQRPDDIVPESEYREILKTYDSSLDRSLASTLGDRVLWTRGLPDPVSDSSYPAGDDMMVKRWHELGFVVPEEYVDRKTGAKQIVYIETERDPYAIKTDRDYFYLLMNIGSFPDFLPTAKRLTHQFLAQAWRNQEEADPDERWKFFRFTAEAFDARMEQIYNNFVHDSESESVYFQQLFKTRDLVIKNLVNFAPFNQLDGTWLRHATPAGPIDDVQSMLFNIY